MSPDQRASKLDGMIKDSQQARENMISNHAPAADLARCEKRLADIREERAAITAPKAPTPAGSALARYVAKAVARELASPPSPAPQGSPMVTIAQLKAANPGLEAAIDNCVLTGSTPAAIAAALLKAGATAVASNTRPTVAAAFPTPKVLTQATPTDQKVASTWSAGDTAETARLLQAGTMSTSREAQTLVNAINHVQRDIANAYGARAQADRALASRNRPWEAMLAPMPGMAAYQNTAILQKRIADNVADHKQTVAAIDAKIDEFRAMQKQWFAELRRHIPVGLI